MRIAVCSDNFYPEIGGIQDSLAALSQELGRRGHDILILAPRPSLGDYRVVHLPPREIALGERVRVRRLCSFPFPSPTLQSRLALPTLPSLFALKAFRPDLIHAHTFLGVGLEALLAAKLFGIPLVGTNHWVITEFSHYAPLAPEWFRRQSIRYVSWYYNQCTYVTAPSNTVLEEMRAWGFRRPHEALSNPIDTETFHPARGRARLALQREFNLSPHALLFAGRFAKEKRIDVLLRAVALARHKVPKIQLVLVGHGSDAAHLHDLVRTLGVTAQVRFPGTLTKPDLARYFRAAALFVIASTSESQSMVLLQAMASGLPVVGVRARALPEYITPETGLLVEPGDASALAEKIIYLLKRPRLRERMGTASRHFAERHGTAPVVDRWERIYQHAA